MKNISITTPTQPDFLYFPRTHSKTIIQTNFSTCQLHVSTPSEYMQRVQRWHLRKTPRSRFPLKDSRFESFTTAKRDLQKKSENIIRTLIYANSQNKQQRTFLLRIRRKVEERTWNVSYCFKVRLERHGWPTSDHIITSLAIITYCKDRALYYLPQPVSATPF